MGKDNFITDFITLSRKIVELHESGATREEIDRVKKTWIVDQDKR